jgi:hypothetical protein
VILQSGPTLPETCTAQSGLHLPFKPDARLMKSKRTASVCRPPIASTGRALREAFEQVPI